MKPTTVLLLVLALVGTAPAIDSLNVRLVGYYQTEAERIAVGHEYACILAFHVGLRLMSVASPDSIFEVGQFDDTTCGYSLAMIDTDYVYLAHHPSGVSVISIADPAHPSEVGFLNTPAPVNGIAVAGQYAYMADVHRLLVVSVADPANPAIVASCDTSDSAVCGVAVSGDHAYVTDYYQGLRVISVADPLHPVEVGHCDLSGTYGCVAVSDSYVFAGGLGETFQSMIISVADPANPTVVESLPYHMTDVAMGGDTIYAPAGAVGLQVFSIRDTAHPLKLGYYEGVGTSQGVASTGGYIYVAAGSALLILQYYQSGVEETPSAEVRMTSRIPTIVRGVLFMGDCPRTGTVPKTVLLDISGKKVLDLHPGANDVSGLAPGVYFCRLTAGFASSAEPSAVSGKPSAATVRKVILQR